MQAQNQTHLDFAHRTEALAKRSNLKLGALPGRLGISRASFFAYRSGKARVTPKAWRKLERAERESGIAESLAEQLVAASPDQQKNLLSSASVEEIMGLFSPEDRARLLTNSVDFQIERMEIQMQGFFLNVGALAGLVLQKKPSRSELLFFARTLESTLRDTQQAWQFLVQQFREVLGLDATPLAERVSGRSKKKR